MPRKPLRLKVSIKKKRRVLIGEDESFSDIDELEKKRQERLRKESEGWTITPGKNSVIVSPKRPVKKPLTMKEIEERQKLALEEEEKQKKDYIAWWDKHGKWDSRTQALGYERYKVFGKWKWRKVLPGGSWVAGAPRKRLPNGSWADNDESLKPLQP